MARLIEYFGGKRFWRDTRHGTGLTLLPNEPQVVADSVAALFCQHADIIRDVTPENGVAADVPVEESADPLAEKPAGQPFIELETVNPAAMDLDQLKAYAQATFGKRVDGRQNIDVLRAQVAGWQREENTKRLLTADE